MKPLACAALTLVLLAGCTPTAPAPTETTPPIVAPVETPEPEPTSPVFLTLSVHMTQATGAERTATLTVYEPTPTSESADEMADLEDCLVYTSNLDFGVGFEGEPAWFGRSEVSVTGSGEWDQEHAVRVETGGYGSIGHGDGVWFADTESCANWISGPGSADFSTYFALGMAEGGIEGVLNWSLFGFADAGDAGGVTYDSCTVELSPHAEALSPAESGWALRTESYGCYMGPASY